MKAVIDENIRISQAAKDHGVPVSTLHDRISGKVSHGDKPGPKPLQSAVEEQQFSTFLVEFSKAGYGKTRKEVQSVGGRVAVDKGMKDTGNDFSAQDGLSDKEGHGSEGKNNNDPAGKAKNSKRDFEQRHDVVCNSKQPHNELRYISEYLVQCVSNAKPRTLETSVKISGARILTGDKCIAILKEREQKQQQENKERKKAEREQQKLAKEEEQEKKKALAVEKALAAKKKALVAAKKAERGPQNITSGTNQQRGKKRSNRPPRAAKLPRVSTDDIATASSTTTTETDVSDWSHNTCCVCFAQFEDDDEVEDWVQCACKRWLHEDCMNDIVYDKYGRELFCPHCSV